MLIGIDFCSNARIAQLIKRSAYVIPDIFSEGEISFCTNRKYPEQHFGARWAAKEAYIKALGLRILAHPLPKIELVHDPVGRPSLLIKDPNLIMTTHALAGPNFKVGISISHESEYSIAVVVIT